jgi:hypothetical protein
LGNGIEAVVEERQLTNIHLAQFYLSMILSRLPSCQFEHLGIDADCQDGPILREETEIIPGSNSHDQYRPVHLGEEAALVWLEAIVVAKTDEVEAAAGGVPNATPTAIGARAVVRTAVRKTDSRSMWVNDLRQRRGYIRATVAIANKNARVVWAVLTSGEPYRFAA